MFPVNDPILVFAILIFSILLAPLIAKRLRVPDLILLLLAGVLLGPNGFGILERSSAVILFGSVGLLYIMFLAGLEIDLHNFSRSGKRSILFGSFTFLIPMIFGTLGGRHILGFPWPTSILLASMFASHTLLAYPIASRLGISRSEPVAITVGATIITDTLALLVLAVIADSARGMTLDLSFWISIAIGLFILTSITWFGIPRLTRWFFQKVTEESNSQYLFVLTIIAACSYLSHIAKMEPIIGAFLVGAAFNRLIPENSVLMNRVVFAGNTLFIPFFLISVGMLVDTRALIHNPRSWAVASVMIILVIATKYAASWISGSIFGYKKSEKNVMFGLSLVQAAATLAAVLVGYDLKLFDETVLNGAIAMIAVTCPLGAWIVDHQGRKMANSVAIRSTPAGLEQRLLVLIANPTTATQTLDFAFLLRDTARPGSIHPVTIVRDDGDIEEAVARGEKLLAHCLTHAASADIPVEPSVHVDVNVTDAIIRAAKELRASAILVGWHEAGKVRKRLFSQIMINLLDACPTRLFACRLVRPVNTSHRIVLFFPPLSERRRDLLALLRDVKFLSRQAGAEIHVHITADNADEIRQKLEKTLPDRPLIFIKSKSSVDARAQMIAGIKEDDMIVLPCERKNSFLWTPTQDKLSEMILSRFPDNNILLAYPNLVTEDNSYLRGVYTDIGGLEFMPHDLKSSMDLSQALTLMVNSAFSNNPDSASEALRLLMKSATSYPVEMPAATMLLHAHCASLASARLLVGLCEHNCEVPGIKTSARIILALLSPADASPERHLKSLSELGRKFHNNETVERIKKATSADEICEIIGEP